MDIADIKPVERKIELVDPGSGSALGIRVSIMSLDDSRLERQKRSFRDEANRLAAKGKHIKAEQEEQNSRELLFAATTGWEWYNPTGKEGDEGYNPDAQPTFDGLIPEWNKKNFMDVVRRLPWFAKQIIAEIDEEKAFFTN